MSPRISSPMHQGGGGIVYFDILYIHYSLTCRREGGLKSCYLNVGTQKVQGFILPGFVFPILCKVSQFSILCKEEEGGDTVCVSCLFLLQPSNREEGEVVEEEEEWGVAEAGETTI